MSRSDWRTRAACQVTNTADFFDDVGAANGTPGMTARLRRWRAKRTCATCPVAAECLAFAVDFRADFGVFGGLDQAERITVRWRRGKTLNRPPRVALFVLASRLRADGYDDEYIAQRMDVTPEFLANLFENPPKAANLAATAIREYAAWPDVEAGYAPAVVAAWHSLAVSHARDMCKAMDELPEYTGPKAEGRISVWDSARAC